MHSKVHQSPVHRTMADRQVNQVLEQKHTAITALGVAVANEERAGGLDEGVVYSKAVNAFHSMSLHVRQSTRSAESRRQLCSSSWGNSSCPLVLHLRQQGG